MIEFNGEMYRIENRIANVGELIITTVFIDDMYPGEILKVHEVEEDEYGIYITVYPRWYEKGMNCFEFVCCLDDISDYDVLTKI